MRLIQWSSSVKKEGLESPLFAVLDNVAVSRPKAKDLIVLLCDIPLGLIETSSLVGTNHNEKIRYNSRFVSEFNLEKNNILKDLKLHKI